MIQPDREILKRHSIFEGPVVPDLQRSHGTWIVDARNGAEYLDFFTYYATSPLGHNHPDLADPAFKSRLAEAAVDKPSLSDVQPREFLEFVEAFERIAVPEELPYLFFISGGALAVENALKTAFDWKVRLNLAAGKGERGSQVLHFREAFHGRSGYTLSLTNTADPRKIQYFPKFDWPRVDNPKCVFPLEGDNLAAVEAKEQEVLAEIRALMDERGDDIAALIIEPIQGEGGDNHFRGEFLRGLRELCDEHRVFYVLDEVQTGLGTTGSMWCYQQFDFVPDAVAFGKKTQTCGIMVSRRVDEAADNVFKVPSRINSTWGGNLVDMVRATRILEVMERDGLVARARERGALLLAKVQEVADGAGGRITNVRGRGLFCAFDLPSTEDRERVRIALREQSRLLALPCGTRSIRFRPPLTVEEAEIDEAADRLEATLTSTSQEA